MDKSDFGLAAYAVMLATLDELERKSLLLPEESQKSFVKAVEMLEELGKQLKPLGIKPSVEILRGVASAALARRKKH